MDKKIIIIIISTVVLLIVLAGGYFYWINLKKSKINNLNTAEDITNSATKGVLPSLQTNPLEEKPNVNPVDRANPIKNVKTNPFE